MGEWRTWTRLPLACCALLLFPYSSFADFTGPIVSVLDGDTVEVLHNTYSERIRLSGIDCPEKGQAYGNNAKQATSALVFGKEVMLQTFGKDKYGRTLADRANVMIHRKDFCAREQHKQRHH